MMMLFAVDCLFGLAYKTAGALSLWECLQILIFLCVFVYSAPICAIAADGITVLIIFVKVGSVPLFEDVIYFWMGKSFLVPVCLMKVVFAIQAIWANRSIQFLVFLGLFCLLQWRSMHCGDHAAHAFAIPQKIKLAIDLLDMYLKFYW